MNKSIKRWALLILCATRILHVSAQVQTRLTLGEAVEKGIENSKQLKVSRAKVDAIRQRATQSRNMLIPSVSLSAGYTRLSDNITPFTVDFPTGSVVLNPQILNQYTNKATVQHTLFSGFKVKYGLESAHYLERAAELDADKDVQDVKLNIINAYFNVLRSANSIKAIDSTIVSLQHKVQDLKNLKANGMAIDNDVLRSELLLNNSLALKADFVSAFETSKYNLALIIGISADQAIELDEHAVEVPVQIGSMENYLSGAEQKRPDILAQQVRTLAQERTVKQNKSAYLPTLGASANYYNNRPNTRQFPLQDQFKNTWDAGLTLTWNLTSLYTNAAVVKEGKAVLAQNRYLHEAAVENAKSEINANYNAYRASEQKVALLGQSLAQAKENRRVFLNRVAYNMNLESDYLDAESQFLQAKINFINAEIDHQLAYYKFNKSIGE